MSRIKHFFVALIFIIAALVVAKPSLAVDIDYGWKPSISSQGKIVGIYNVGEQGGSVGLICNAKTHKLEMSYSFKGNLYDIYVFRKFGVVDMSSPTNEGKFLVGGDTVSQADVYSNIMNADKSFTIARFPIGSKAKWDKAIKAGAVPNVVQEGDEQFLVGNDIKKLLGALSVDCPVKPTDETPIF